MDLFYFTIQFINGATNLLPDSLSRRPDLCNPSPLEERIVFGPKLTTSGTDKQVHVIEQLATGNLEDQVINSQSNYSEFPRLNGLAKSNPNHKTFTMINNVLLMNNLFGSQNQKDQRFYLTIMTMLLLAILGNQKPCP